MRENFYLIKQKNAEKKRIFIICGGLKRYTFLPPQKKTLRSFKSCCIKCNTPSFPVPGGLYHSGGAGGCASAAFSANCKLFCKGYAKPPP